MPPQIHTCDGNAREATTFVCKLDESFIYAGVESPAEFGNLSMYIGVHPASRSVVVHFDEPQTTQSAQSKLRTAFGNGGIPKTAIKTTEAFDMFHAESMGCLAVNMPTMPVFIDTIVEGDDLSDVEFEWDLGCPSEDASDGEDSGESTHPVETAIATYTDIFAMTPVPGAMELHVPSMAASLLEVTSAQLALRTKLVAAGGPLTEYLENRMFPTGLRHVKDVQEAARDRVRMKPPVDVSVIVWLTTTPIFITVYGKPLMATPRRIAWIEWKADAVGVELTLPVFMAFFKQIAFCTTDATRLQQYKVTVAQWQRKPLMWKELPVDVRNLIMNINVGKLDCYCKNCHSVVDPMMESAFCCQDCASKFCHCGEKLEHKQVNDPDLLELQRARLGPHSQLVELFELYQLKSQVLALEAMDEKTAAEIDAKKKAEKTCRCIPGWFDGKECNRCKYEHIHSTRLSQCQMKLRSGAFTWGHLEAAAEILKTMCALPMPTKTKSFCSACSACDAPPHKRQRVF